MKNMISRRNFLAAAGVVAAAGVLTACGGSSSTAASTAAASGSTAAAASGDTIKVGVMGPMTGGILLAHEVGKALGTRAIFTEREKGVMTLRRGFHIEPGERVLIVEDIVTTGGSVQEVVDVVNKAGGVIVGVGLLVDRSGGKAEFGVPKDKVQALLHLTVPTYKPEECPLCKQSIPMTERGSHHLK
mgnify:CR=1 FL=1